MNFREIAALAQQSGYDLITVESMGAQTIVTCEQRMSTKEPWTVELDVSFGEIEHTALAELSQAGLDACFTSKGIRAFGKQSTGLDAIRTASNLPRHVLDNLPRTFEPQGIHRDDFNVEQEQPKPERQRRLFY